MRTLGFLLLMIVFIVLLSNVGAYIGKNNGIPDVFQRLYPEKFVDTEEKRALETGIAPFESDAPAPVSLPPEQAYTAPISKQEAAANKVDLDAQAIYDPLGDNVNVTESLDIPHRHEAAVSAWVTESVSEVLNFTLQGFDAHKQKLPMLMNQNGIDEFMKFLDSSKVLALMQSKGYELKTFVMDIPQMRTSGVADGKYRWVYDVPVNMTFLPAGVTSYEGLEESQYQLEHLTFRVQIGRVHVPKECGQIELHKQRGVCHGMVIETWEALKRQKQQ